jgi:hypothetical protein
MTDENENEGQQGVDPDLGAGPDSADEDRDGMAGQLDDSMNALDDEDDVGEASRGVPQ